MKKIFAFFALILVAVSAHAAIQHLDLGQIILGQTYTVGAEYNYGTLKGTILAPESGLLTVTGLSGGVWIYEDAAHTQMLEGEWNGTYGPSMAYNFMLTEGVTYYAYCDWINWSSETSTLLFEMASGVQVSINQAYPAPGEMVSSKVNDTGEIILMMNCAVTYGNATLSCGETTSVVASTTAEPSAFIAVKVGPTISSWYANGVLQETGGETITLTFNGLASVGGNLYNGDGVLAINYIAAPKLVDLVTANIPSYTLKSYYPIGDEQAQLEFVFDKPLKEDDATYFTLGIGNVEVDEGYYLERIPCVVSGTSVKVDLSGKLRELSRYASLQGSEIVEAKLYNVRDIYGNKAMGAGDEFAGSYIWNFEYSYIEPVDVVSEFTPGSGTIAPEVAEIEIWFNHADMVIFDGVSFSWADGNAVVPKSELTITKEGTSELAIIVKIPQAARGNDNVTVTLANMIGLDGYDHTAQVSAVYNIAASNSIDSLTADAAKKYEVYTLDGKHVLSTTNAIELRQLSPGFYLINGKKYRLK